jgi:hemoglobin
MMPDIKDTDDIKRLIDTFYQSVTADELLGPIFNEIAHINWEHHLPVMYGFWDFLLLGGKQYTGNPIQKHFDLHQRYPLSAEMFDRWLQIFLQTVDQLFAGKVADDAKFRAFAIAETWKPKFSPHHGIGIVKN